MYRMKKRSKKIILIIFAILIVLYGPYIFITIINPNLFPGVSQLAIFIEEHARLPSSENEYSQWIINNYPGISSALQFNFVSDISPENLEIRDNRLVYKDSGELCCLIFGGKSKMHDILHGWKYNRVSVNLFRLLKDVKERERNQVDSAEVETRDSHLFPGN